MNTENGDISVRQWAIDDIAEEFRAAGVRRPRKTAVLAVNAFADWLVGFDDLRDALNEGRTRGQRPDLVIIDETHGFMTTEGIATTLTQPLIGQPGAFMDGGVSTGLHSALHAAAVVESYRLSVQAVNGDVELYDRLISEGRAPMAAYQAVITLQFAEPPAPFIGQTVDPRLIWRPVPFNTPEDGS